MEEKINIIEQEIVEALGLFEILQSSIKYGVNNCEISYGFETMVDLIYVHLKKISDQF